MKTLFTTARINYPLPRHTYLPPSKGIITEDKALGERSGEEGTAQREEVGRATVMRVRVSVRIRGVHTAST